MQYQRIWPILLLWLGKRSSQILLERIRIRDRQFLDIGTGRLTSIKDFVNLLLAAHTRRLIVPFLLYYLWFDTVVEVHLNWLWIPGQRMMLKFEGTVATLITEGLIKFLVICLTILIARHLILINNLLNQYTIRFDLIFWRRHCLNSCLNIQRSDIVASGAQVGLLSIFQQINQIALFAVRWLLRCDEAWGHTSLRFLLKVGNQKDLVNLGHVCSTANILNWR